MCGGVQFDYNGQTIQTYFPNPKARLPVITRQGERILVPWGRRETQPGLAPLGGWARRESIHQGAWQRFQPRPVKIVIDAFMEKDIKGNSYRYSLEPSQFIQGLIATDSAFIRLYVVTEESNQSHHINNRWPRLITDKTLNNKTPTRLF